jgi:hypothetical protein
MLVLEAALVLAAAEAQVVLAIQTVPARWEELEVLELDMQLQAA